MICRQCGKEITGEGIAFCPFCGVKIVAAENAQTSAEAEEWVRKALKITSLPERKKLLDQAKQACPDAPEIDWELLFIGTPNPKPKRGRMDFSIIKSWLLQIYRNPGEFSAEERNAMRHELFEGEKLRAILAASADPEAKMQEYLNRLCREYIEIFLKEDNRLMGNIFGFRLGKNRMKPVEDAVNGMIRLMEADEKLSEDRRSALTEAMRLALREMLIG